MDQHTGDTWLIYGTQCHMGDELQSLQLSCRKCKADIKSLLVTYLIKYFKKRLRGTNIPRGELLLDQNYPVQKAWICNSNG